MMSIETDNTRMHALSAVEASGMTWARHGKGQRYVVHLRRHDGEEIIKALVKTASRGSAMVKTSSDDPIEAKLSGFGPDIDHVLFAVGEPATGDVRAYLVPVNEVEQAYRRSHREWRENRPESNPSTTWVIWFSNSGSPEANGYGETWKRYLVGRSAGAPVGSSGETLSIAEAKERLAHTFGVSPSSVKITIEG